MKDFQSGAWGEYRCDCGVSPDLSRTYHGLLWICPICESNAGLDKSRDTVTHATTEWNGHRYRMAEAIDALVG